MNAAQPTRWFLRAFLIAATFLLFAPKHSYAQQQGATCTDWADVQSWSGTITLSGSGTSTDQSGNTLTTAVSATINFTNAANNGSNPCFPGVLGTWVAPSSQVTSSVTIHDVVNGTCQDNNNIQQPFVEHYDVSNGTTSIGYVDVRMDFSNPTAPTYIVFFGQTVDGVVESSPVGCAPFSINEPPGSLWGPGLRLGVIPPIPPPTALPASISPLVGSVAFQSYDQTLANGNPTWTLSWNIAPAPPDLDVMVTIPGYGTWRPTAGRSETNTGANTDVGNLLFIQAQLIQKSTGKPPLNIIPDKWSFSLLDVSHEPGLVMNWPAQKHVLNPSPPDMTFDKLLNHEFNPDLTITDNDTLAEIDNPSQTSNPQDAQVILVPFDWGGWATLHVSAIVQGQTIQGHLKLPDGSEVTDILLPLRQQGSFIADSWKNAHGIPLSTPDNDDSDNNPKGDGQVGDGLTLYEEYRGFYMGCSDNKDFPQPEGTPGATCQHAEGDPKTKDLFVVDLIGASEGIGQFGFGSALNVHYAGLKLAEVGPQSAPSGPSTYRVINFNHANAPHMADEHALVIDWAPVGIGISMVVNTSDISCPNPPLPHACRPGLPREIDRILMTRDFKTSLNFQFNDQFITVVAHELGHAVDVYHHGEIDGNKWWALDPATGNVTEQDLGANGGPLPSTLRTINVMYEDDDPSQPKTTISDQALNLDVDADGKPLTGRRVYVGNNICGGTFVQNGQHSGDQLSFMRYDSAEAYIPVGFPTVRFWIGEQAGAVLTNHPIGTGVNDPNRTVNNMRRVRYGDAFASTGDDSTRRGNDSAQLDVNDNHTAIIRPDQTCP